MTRTRGARCDRSGSNSGEGSAGPEPKIATVERREAGVPRYGTQGASLGAWPAALRAGPTGASQAPDDSRRSATPSIGVAKPKFQNPGAKKRAAGTKRCCLVPRLSVRHSGRAAIAARAGIHNHRPWVWIPGSQASPAPRNDAEKVRRGSAPLRGAREPTECAAKANEMDSCEPRAGVWNHELRLSSAGRPRPEERACERRCANSHARARVSKDEDGP